MLIMVPTGVQRIRFLQSANCASTTKATGANGAELTPSRSAGMGATIASFTSVAPWTFRAAVLVCFGVLADVFGRFAGLVTCGEGLCGLSRWCLKR